MSYPQPRTSKTHPLEVDFLESEVLGLPGRFDMMLMRLCSGRGIGPGFLLHDSHLFDGVDERQVATALRLGARIADEYGFQYIVTMNSDAVPTTMPEDFVLEDHFLSVKLTDATEEGGLFGVRF